MISSKSFLELQTPDLPCHTQSAERHIELVTEASGSACGLVSREGIILNKLAWRAAMPYFNTKSDYRPLT